VALITVRKQLLASLGVCGYLIDSRVLDFISLKVIDMPNDR